MNRTDIKEHMLYQELSYLVSPRDRTGPNHRTSPNKTDWSNSTRTPSPRANWTIKRRPGTGDSRTRHGSDSQMHAQYDTWRPPNAHLDH